MKAHTTMKKILAVASGGGHWVQLLRLRQAFAGCAISYLTTKEDYASDVEGRLFTVADANIREKVRLARMFLQVAWVMLKVRPDIVITTGAAPGFAAMLFGRMIGARTIWLDSIANSEELSTSGKHAKRWADVWLTQWPHLAHVDGPAYWGGVL